MNELQVKEKIFVSGDSIRYARRIYDEKELVDGVDSMLEFWLTVGMVYAGVGKGSRRISGGRACGFNQFGFLYAKEMRREGIVYGEDDKKE